jgi:hypothetical protein
MAAQVIQNLFYSSLVLEKIAQETDFLTHGYCVNFFVCDKGQDCTSEANKNQKQTKNSHAIAAAVLKFWHEVETLSCRGDVSSRVCSKG